MNSEYYPTPKSLIKQMMNKVSRCDITYMLEPSAGKGNIVEYIKDDYRIENIHAIENDQEFVAILRSKHIQVIDYDFLSFNGVDKYDLIIANPPFNNGDRHLLKAIDIMYSGHIVFLLNAETLKNPYTNTRKILNRKLEELNAEIEYLQGAFELPGTEKKTNVEVALIHIFINKETDEDLFNGVENSTKDIDGELHKPQELATKDSLKELVASYDRTINIGTNVLLDFYKNYFHISPYLHIVSTVGESRSYSDEKNITDKMKKSLNTLVRDVRKDYWQKTLQLECVLSRMTKNRQDKFHKQLNENAYMDFTESNILTFITNLIGGYEDVLNSAVDEIFDYMTRTYAWDEEIHNKNVHYFNGWKTNKSFYINHKVILPFYGDAFVFYGKWKVGYAVKRYLDDIDKVMNYFDGRHKYTSIVNSLEIAFSNNENKAESTYFTIIAYKKGTIHLKFKDRNIVRRFSVTACKNKKWLPDNYGNCNYKNLNVEEKTIVDSFEGSQKYDENITTAKNLYANKNLKQLPFYEKL